jgi:hypothetical protein
MYIVILKKDEEVENVLNFLTENEAIKWAKEITEAVEWSSCIVTQVSEPFEIIWDKHQHMEKVQQLLDSKKEYHFTHPYICVIHEPTKRGYYLDRGYGFICSVENIIRPCYYNRPRTLTRFVEIETEHQAASFTEWAKKLPSNEFTSYWLY